MATLLRAPFFQAAPVSYLSGPSSSSKSAPKPFYLTFKHRCTNDYTRSSIRSLIVSSTAHSVRFLKLATFASSGETEVTETEEVQEPEVQEPEVQQSFADNFAEDGANDAMNDDTNEDKVVDTDEVPSSFVISSLQLYKEALANNDESKIAEIESFLRSIEDERILLEEKTASLTEELSTEKARILRISADFDNFRKRTDRERLSLVTNAQGELVESLLPVLDNFERAKAQIKIETEGEENINQSYQNIYKQFVEILNSLGVVPVDTVGKPFNPLLHEAIMREESAEFEEGTILEEFRKGFSLGDRLLRPSMVKVSAGPGPTKSEESGSPAVEDISEAAEKRPESESS